MKGAAEIGHEAELGCEQLQKGSGARRQYDVAGQRETHSCARSDAVDCNHDRYAQLVPGVDHGIEMFPQAVADIFAAASLWIAQKIVAHEIGAGTKGAARGGEHDRANVSVGVDRGRRGA